MAGRTFRFSLQNVLELRRREADSAELELSHAVRARRDQEAALEEVRRHRASACDAAGASGRTPSDPASLRRSAGFLDDLRASEHEAGRRLERLLREEAEARRALVARRRPEEALRLLRDREADAHHRAIAEAEMAFLDEQAITGHARRQRASRL